MTETIRKEKKLVETEVTVEHILKCDLCGVVADDPNGCHGGATWDGDQYTIDIVAIHTKVGTSYPEGGNYDEETFDICPNCYRDKVRPFLVSAGAIPRKKTVDW